MNRCDFESSTNKTNEAENAEVNPSELSLESLTEDNNEGENENGDVDAKLSNGDAFREGDHFVVVKVTAKRVT